MVSQIDLSDFFITKSQATDFIQSLDNIIEQLYEVDFNLEKTLTNEFGMKKKDKFMELLRNIKMNNSSNELMKELFVNIQETVKKIPVLSLTIAFEPDETNLKAFLQWFLFSLNRQIIIDVQVDRNIIAGAAINFNGKYKDYSVKPLFDEVIKQKLFSANKTERENTDQINSQANLKPSN